jgi:phage terminase large subunit-like protein
MRAYGTLKPNGQRRYRYVFVEIPKKNGKTELCAAVALIGLCGDDEKSPEVYCCAGDKEQASLSYRPAASMVRANRTLKKRLTVRDSIRRIIDPVSAGFIQVLSAEAFTKHGLSPSHIIFDEIHAQPNRELWDVMTEGTDIARPGKQLVWVITTAGVEDKTSIGWEIHEYARQVHEGVVEDPEWLTMMFCADRRTDNWEDKEVWKRVNPSLGYIFDMDNLERHYQAVKNNPARINNFLRYRLNMWVGQSMRVIPMDKWKDCNTQEFDLGELIKRPCYAGLDLSTKVDMTAFVLLFPPMSQGERWKVIGKYYVPEETIFERTKNDKVPYDLWRRAGHITATPGASIDYAQITKDILEAAAMFTIVRLAYDPWNAHQMGYDLDENHGIPVVEMRQGYKSMSEPTKELLRLIIAGEIEHYGNRVLSWAADNLVVTQDPAENIKPAKNLARERIDPIVALINAIGAALNEEDGPSRYEDEESEVMVL